MIKDKSRDVVKQASKTLQKGKHGPGLVGEDSKSVTDTSTDIHVWREFGFVVDLGRAGKPHVMVGSVRWNETAPSTAMAWKR